MRFGTALSPIPWQREEYASFISRYAEVAAGGSSGYCASTHNVSLPHQGSPTLRLTETVQPSF